MMKARASWQVAAVVGLSLSLLACEGSVGASCDDGERTYRDGAQWTCKDGCNNCGCSDGSVLTTAIGCSEPPGPAAGKLKCEEAGAWHTHGDSWTTKAGCELSCDDGELVGDCS